MGINLKHSALNFEAKTVIEICLLVIVLKNNKYKQNLKVSVIVWLVFWFCDPLTTKLYF